MRWRGAAGYSLVEVVASVAIFALVALVLLGGLTRALKQWRDGQQQTDALAGLRTAAAWLGRDARTAGPSSNCTSGTDCTFVAPDGTAIRYTFAAGVLSRNTGSGAIPVAAGLSSVTMTLVGGSGARHRLLTAQLQAGTLQLQVTLTSRNF